MPNCGIGRQDEGVGSDVSHPVNGCQGQMLAHVLECGGSRLGLAEVSTSTSPSEDSVWGSGSEDIMDITEDLGVQKEAEGEETQEGQELQE